MVSIYQALAANFHGRAFGEAIPEVLGRRLRRESGVIRRVILLDHVEILRLLLTVDLLLRVGLVQELLFHFDLSPQLLK